MGGACSRYGCQKGYIDGFVRGHGRGEITHLEGRDIDGRIILK